MLFWAILLNSFSDVRFKCFDLRKLDNERLPMTTLNFSFNLITAVFKLLLSLLLAFILTACAHTEKYLHPERTFSLDAYDSEEAGIALQGTTKVALPIHEVCADKASSSFKNQLQKSLVNQLSQADFIDSLLLTYY
jgi:hypothetical protein